jgi:uncharacterized protein
MPSRAIVILLAWISLVSACAAQTLSFPVLAGRIVDEAGVLSATFRTELTDSLADLEAKTTDQLVIVTLKSLRGTSIEDYGYQLGRRWQIGQKDKNNGVLLIVAPNERQVRIEVGYGLEGTLTDAISKFIIENSILPRFKAGDLAGGIKRGVEDIVQALSGDAEEWKRRAVQNLSSNDAGPRATDPVWLAILIMVVGAGLLIYCAATGGPLCQILLIMLLSGRRGSSRGGSSWSGGGGSFGGGGASGRW